MLLPRLLLSAVPLAVLPAIVLAQPTKPIRMVTSSPGGSSDFAARLMAQGVLSSSGQQVIVDNRGGGMIPPTIVSQATPDGQTLLIYTSTLWIAPLLEKTPYDAVKDFAPVTAAAGSPNVIVVHPLVAAQSVKELIALAKTKPGALNYASGGTGASSHLSAELFKAMAGVNIARIPYKSAGPAINDLLGGHVQVMFPTAPSVAPHTKAGRLRALAVTTAKPSGLAPGLPTVAASGLPGYESVSVIGVFAPAKTPQATITRVNQVLVKALNSPEVKEKLFSSGTEVIGNASAEFLADIKSDVAKYRKLIREADIKAD